MKQLVDKKCVDTLLELYGSTTDIEIPFSGFLKTSMLMITKNTNENMRAPPRRDFIL